MLALIFGQITVIFAQPINFELLANETIYDAWQGQLYHRGSMSYYEIKVSFGGAVTYRKGFLKRLHPKEKTEI